jgi:hypothetical protein
MSKVKRIDLLNLWHALESVKGKKVNIKFSYFVAKNRLSLKNEREAINEAQEPSEVFKTYDQDRGTLAEKFADKDPNGKPIIQNNQYVITEKWNDFEKELEKLKKKYKKVIDERNEQLEKLKEFLNEEVEFEGHQIKLDNLPSDLEPNIVEIFLVTNLIMD